VHAVHKHDAGAPRAHERKGQRRTPHDQRRLPGQQDRARREVGSGGSHPPIRTSPRTACSRQPARREAGRCDACRDSIDRKPGCHCVFAITPGGPLSPGENEAVAQARAGSVGDAKLWISLIVKRDAVIGTPLLRVRFLVAPSGVVERRPAHGETELVRRILERAAARRMGTSKAVHIRLATREAGRIVILIGPDQVAGIGDQLSVGRYPKPFVESLFANGVPRPAPVTWRVCHESPPVSGGSAAGPAPPPAP